MGVIKLAFFNVLRRMSRSILALMAMAIAAAVLTSGLSLSQGLPNLALANYREMFQGEILAFSPGFVGVTPISTEQTPLVRRNIIDSGFNPVLKFYPALRNGYYAEQHWQYTPFSANDIARLLSTTGVTGVNPYYAFPAKARGANVDVKMLPLADWPDADPRVPFSYDLDIVLNAYSALKADVGEVVEIGVPQYTMDQQGLPYVDSSQPPVIYRGRVVGHVTIPTRSISWMTYMGPEEEQGYLHSQDILVREADWKRIWQQHSDSTPFPYLAMGINIANMAELNLVARDLREAFPEVAFVTIPDFVHHLNRYTLLDRFYRAPAMLWRGESHDTHPLAREDFSYITACLLFLNAGMLLASQMLTAVAGRRNEIGILKAIGSRKGEVVGMILLEAVIVAVIGSVAGFTVIRAAGIHLSVTNSVPIVKIIGTTLRELQLVMALTLSLSLAFGVLPAWKVARLTVMDVFRNG